MEPTNKPMEHEVSHSPRYGLSSLFYVTAVIAAAIALLGAGGIFWAVLVLAFWFLNFRNFNLSIAKIFTKPSIAEIIVAIVVIGMLVGMLLPTTGGHQVGIRTIHASRIKQICLAFLNYESANGHFPPAYIADEHGTPIHSWRVLILPYLDHQALYDQYDFSEPWNGPSNSKLANQLPTYFSVNPFGSSDERPALTGFKLVTGPETAFVEDKTKGFVDITAGSSNVIMLVHDNVNPVNWMSPVDAPLEQATELFGYKNATPSWVSENQFQITRRYFKNVGMFDGATYHVGYLEDASEMREHFTIATPPETSLEEVDFRYRSHEFESKPGGYILVAINFFLALLPAFRTRKKAQDQFTQPTST